MTVLLLAACGRSAATTAPEPTPTPRPPLVPTATSAPTATPVPEATGFDRVVACMEERLGTEVARELLAGDRQETPEEQTVLEGCLLVTASGLSSEDLSPAATACFEEQVGTGVVAIVGSGARQLTSEEEAVLLDCVATSALAPPEEEPVSSLEACLADQLGEDIAAVVASGAIPLTAEEEAILGECLLSPSSDTATETVSEGVAACLEEQLGADIAAVVASGAIPLTAEEEAVMGDCLLQEALGGSP